MPFKVTSWDVEHGTGRIVDVNVGEFVVTRQQLQVDDLVVGELVEAVFEEDAAGTLVARDVVPVAWRENALPMTPSTLTDSLAATMKQANAVFSVHTRLVVTALEEDRVRLELHDVDWPPPITPPLASFAFDGVAYVKLRPFSEDVTAVSAVPWRAFRRERARILRAWSLAPDDVSEDAFVFRFEPRRFAQSAGYVVACALTFTRGAKR